MKKVVLYIITLALILTACGSGEVVEADCNSAKIDVISASGQLLLATSQTQLSKELAKQNPIMIDMAVGEMVTVYFNCETCGHVESFVMVAQSEELFYCECPKMTYDNGNTRKYVKVILGPCC